MRHKSQHSLGSLNICFHILDTDHTANQAHLWFLFFDQGDSRKTFNINPVGNNTDFFRFGSISYFTHFIAFIKGKYPVGLFISQTAHQLKNFDPPLFKKRQLTLRPEMALLLFKNPACLCDFEHSLMSINTMLGQKKTAS
ncbi:MAG: hypothetical protein ACD_73C00313G0001 [uncultured bacterium]|nr:MAG: hypothetical protein ACD_73C00313G0001 [uncultured bacterium]